MTDRIPVDDLPHVEIGPTGHVRKIRKPRDPSSPKNPHAVALGRRRMSTLSHEERSALATRASHAAQAASTPEFRAARAQAANAARWAGHASPDQRLDPVGYLLSRGVLTEADLSHPEYTITRARHMKRYLVVRCAPYSDGFKGRVDRLLSNGLGCRYVDRERGYLISVPKAEEFVLLCADGWDADTASGELIAPVEVESEPEGSIG